MKEYKIAIDYDKRVVNEFLHIAEDNEEEVGLNEWATKWKKFVAKLTFENMVYTITVSSLEEYFSLVEEIYTLTDGDYEIFNCGQWIEMF